MKIKNIKVYGLEESIIRSGYPMQTGEPDDIYESDGELLHFIDDRNLNRSKKLAKTPVGSGHNNFLKGIIVQFDLKYPQYFTPQLQRYHWIDIISSQSKMHKLTSVTDIKESCNKYVSTYFIDRINNWIYQYNNHLEYPQELFNETIIVNSKEELFQYIISNLPMGYEMWMGISSNYLQLKTIYNQRKNHKLKDDWGYFCDFIKGLPLANELILIE